MKPVIFACAALALLSVADAKAEPREIREACLGEAHKAYEWQPPIGSVPGGPQEVWRIMKDNYCRRLTECEERGSPGNAQSYADCLKEQNELNGD